MARKSRFGLILAAVLTAAALLTILIMIIPLAREPELDLELPDRGMEGSENTGRRWDGAVRKPGSEMEPWNSGTKPSDAPAGEEEPGPEGSIPCASKPETVFLDEDLLEKYRDKTFTPRKFCISGRVVFSDTGAPAPGAKVSLWCSIRGVPRLVRKIKSLRSMYSFDLANSPDIANSLKENLNNYKRIFDRVMRESDLTPFVMEEEVIEYMKRSSPLWRGRSDDNGEFLVRFSKESPDPRRSPWSRDKKEGIIVLRWDLPCVMLLQASIENEQATYHGQHDLRLTDKETIEVTITISRETINQVPGDDKKD